MDPELIEWLKEHNISEKDTDVWQQRGSVGKFEGEPLYVQYFYEQSLDGGGMVLEITCAEQQAFGLGPNDNYVYLYESGDGFVSASFFEYEDDANDEEMMDLGIDDETLDSHEAEEEY